MHARVGARDLGADMEAKKQHPVFGMYDIVVRILYGDPCFLPEGCKKLLSLLLVAFFGDCAPSV